MNLRSRKCCIALSFCFILLVGSIPLSTLAKRDTLRFKEKSPTIGEVVIEKVDSLRIKNLQSAESIKISHSSKKVDVVLSDRILRNQIRYSFIKEIDSILRGALDTFSKYGIILKAVPKEYKINFEVNNIALEKYIPNSEQDAPRIIYYNETPQKDKTLIENSSRTIYNKGLSDVNIALWAGHGYYYNSIENRWMVQRAELFTTVEDFSNISYINDLLVPMLRNAGANIYSPKELDYQDDEIIVDNESRGFSLHNISPDSVVTLTGFKYMDKIYGNDNPFTKGTALRIQSSNRNSYAQFSPYIEKEGAYNLYVTWAANEKLSSSVTCTVKHNAGEDTYLIKQNLSGGTWFYIGNYKLNAGESPTIKFSTKVGEFFSVDAIKLGGGKGNVYKSHIGRMYNKSLNTIVATSMTEFSSSEVPRFAEAGRYYLQSAGFPQDVYSPSDGRNDYTDDYRCRALWLNSLKDPLWLGGKNIPIDLSLAFHTNAGVMKDDLLYGTMGIFYAKNNYYKGWVGSLISRDYADILCQRISMDISKAFNIKWPVIEMRNKGYHECFKPSVPAMIIELLSHQNFNDAKFHLNPNFRFVATRAIYKGILEWLYTSQKKDYEIAPLAPNSLKIEILSENKVRLSWKETIDTLSYNAAATSYKIYTRINSNGFNSISELVKENFLEIDIKKGDVYSFKVTALNSGGESFPSEILSVGISQLSVLKKVALIVNCFESVRGPDFIETDMFKGVHPLSDKGVPYGVSHFYIGKEISYSPEHQWITDDAQGFGSTNSQNILKPFIGNTYDNVYAHGKAFMDNGISFTSTSKKAFVDSNKFYSPNNFLSIDLLMGHQRAEVLKPLFDSSFVNILESWAYNTSFLVSGSYLGSDINLRKDSSALSFFTQSLNVYPRVHLYSQENIIEMKHGLSGKMRLEKHYLDASSPLEHFEVLEPLNGAINVATYKDGGAAAMVFGIDNSNNRRVVICGFPFECYLWNNAENVKEVLEFLTDGRR